MKKAIFFLLIALLLFTINNLAHSIYSLWQKQGHLERARQDLQKAKRENQRLGEQNKIVSSPQFVEEEARNKLLLTKPGEQIVILPKRISERKKQQPKKEQPYWQQWLTIFW
ncbi:MAG: septum formation initiator family protein [Candidatus Levybacteria bacterium]|nr:septum formation initiator family protein [Candidatus Levybacteria bacterium]